MKRYFTVVLAFTCWPIIASAQQQVITAATPGVTVGGGGATNGTQVLGFGDNYPFWISTASPFSIESVDVASQTGFSNGIVIRGYSTAYVDQFNRDFAAGLYDRPFPSAFGPVFWGTPTFVASLTASPSMFITVPLGWTDLRGVVFNSSCGFDPGGGQACNYLLDNILIEGPVLTPEPATMLLFATGLLGMLAVQRRACPSNWT